MTRALKIAFTSNARHESPIPAAAIEKLTGDLAHQPLGKGRLRHVAVAAQFITVRRLNGGDIWPFRPRSPNRHATVMVQTSC